MKESTPCEQHSSNAGERWDMRTWFRFSVPWVEVEPAVESRDPLGLFALGIV